MNDIVREAGVAQGLGLGESIGRHILDSDYPHKDFSVLAAGVRLGVPVTVHIGIGYDILHEHPNFDPAAFGTASYRDFLAVCSHGRAARRGRVPLHGLGRDGAGGLSQGPVDGPQRGPPGRPPDRQLHDGRLRPDSRSTATGKPKPPRRNPQYYYRPWKTILVRTVADGGESFYVCGDHRQTVPYLRQAAAVNASLP